MKSDATDRLTFRRTSRGIASFVTALVCAVTLGGGEGRADTGDVSLSAHPVAASQKLLDGQAAALLPDGRWLLVGGEQSGVMSGAVSFSDPRSSALQKQSALPTPQMSLVYPRSGETATVLPDGTVAVLGGIGADGKIVGAAEIIDPQTGESRVIAATGLQPRSSQTATLLTDGQVLIAGGSGPDGKPLSSAELWDPVTGSAQSVDGGLTTARSTQQATLLANGSVMISGGRDSTGQMTTAAEIYDPQSNTFSPVSATDSARLTASMAAGGTPSVEAILPSTDAGDVAVDARIAIRLNAPAAVSPDMSRAVSVVGPAGDVAGKVVAAEGGLLLFFTPSVDLLPQSTYTVFVHGVTDRSGQPLPFNASSFTTRSFNDGTQSAVRTASANSGTVAQKSAQSGKQLVATSAAINATPEKPATKPAAKPDTPADDDSGPEDWSPREKNRHGTWRVLGLTGDPVLVASRVANLSAPGGQTAVSGRILRYHGRPLAGVAVRIGDKSGVTDSSGRFLLTGLTPGVTQLQIDGTAVIVGGRHYTKHFVRVEVVAGKTNSIGDPVYLPRVDPATEVTIPSPTTRELVLTHPAIPGLEVHIPKGVVLREYDGKIVTKLSITPVPLDRPPYPTPTSFSVYFTLQPGGAFIDADAGKSIRVIYPNYAGLAPGSRPNFWNYDPVQGWQIYGQGTVSADGKQVIPDANVGFRQIISFGMGIDNSRKPAVRAPPVNGCVRGGDPVDCATGLFLHSATDLAIRDVLPISATRTYQQGDTDVRAFGVGTNLSYNMWLYTATTSGTPQEIDLVLADGSRVPYLLQSGASLANGAWIHTGTPSVYFGSVLKAFNNGSGGEGFTITLRNNTVFKFAPHAPNGLLAITDPNGNTLSMTVTSPTVGGQITRVTSPSGRFIQFTWVNGVIVQANDNIGRTVTYNYDSKQRLVSVTDAAGKIESYTYDSNGLMSTVTDRRGNAMVTNQYDDQGRVSQQTLADGAIWKFSYATLADGSGTVTTTTDPRTFVRQDTFNLDGYLTKEIRAKDQPEQQTETLQRDGANIVISTTDSLGRVTTYAHDGLSNVTGATRLAGTSQAVTESFTYDPVTQALTSHTDGMGHTTKLGYDWLGNLTSATDPLGNSIQLTNDSQGRPIALTNALGKVTRLAYDQGDLSSVTNPLGQTMYVFTDAVGRTFGATDPLGRNRRAQYDSLDRPTQITDPVGGVTGYSYDENGNLLSVQDPRNLAPTAFTYDSRNRVHTETDPLGHVETYNYDGMGNLVSKVDRKNQTTSYSYDALNRPKTITYADGSTVTFTWDAADRPTQFADSANGTITRQYDGLDRMTEEVTPRGQVDYLYDAAGRRTQLTVAGYPLVTYQYDDADRLTQITQGTAVVGLAYDSTNRQTAVTLPNGVLGTFAFDDADELTSISYDKGAVHVGDVAYTYDLSGQRTGQTGSLARLGIPSTVSTAAYDAANRLTTWGSTSLTYDNNGNMTAQGTSGYGWNSRNQLISTTDGGGSFAYDAIGRRTTKTVSATTTPYFYDGMNAATVAGNFMLDGSGLDESYAQVGTATTSFLSDAAGSTAALTDGAGAIVATYTYEPYGATAKTGTADTPFQFTGRENDAATNLYYYRARYYSPALGRFISEDPIGLAGGPDLYAYASGNPISLIDALGLLDYPSVVKNYPLPSVYPTSPVPGQTTIWNLIGGKVAQNGNSGAFQNSCSVRMSYALNQSGSKIPFVKGATVSGANGDWYFFRVADLERYLNSLLGAPQKFSPQNWQSGIGNQTGILEFLNHWSNATGHFDLYNGSTTIDGHDYSTEPSARGVQFYPVK